MIGDKRGTRDRVRAMHGQGGRVSGAPSICNTCTARNCCIATRREIWGGERRESGERGQARVTEGAGARAGGRGDQLRPLLAAPPTTRSPDSMPAEQKCSGGLSLYSQLYGGCPHPKLTMPIRSFGSTQKELSGNVRYLYGFLKR